MKKFKSIIHDLKQAILESRKNISNLDVTQTHQSIISTQQTINTTKKDDPNIEYSSPKSFSNINYQHQKSILVSNNWFLVAGSSIGKSHILGNKLCQDNHLCTSINESWGIAVVCDGAGSAENSHLGSEFVSIKAVGAFTDLLKFNRFTDYNKLPNEEEWQRISTLAFRNIYNSLTDFAREKKIEFNSLACTIIVIVFTPFGLLTSHIGDGRAGYCNERGEWKSLIKPHKGEEANQTIFITSSPWVYADNYRMSDVLVPESTVISEKVMGFTIMSDGCESHSYDCSKMDYENNKWIDPNLPSEKFFNPLLKQIKSMHDYGVSPADIISTWLRFIEEGTVGLKNESDDKTLILGISF